MKYNLLWEDNFTRDGRPDPEIWNVETGGTGFGNNESQFYSDDSRNVSVENGVLKITALHEEVGNRHYSSAKLTTRGKKSIRYGKVEVSAKLPMGKGTWPAIWMLGDNIRQIGWPLCGEIDIMEHVGRNPGVVHFSLHSETYNFHKNNHPTLVLKAPQALEGFHKYGLVWEEGTITFLFDDEAVAIFHRQPEDTEKEWPFDEGGFYLILNLAVGGNWGGEIDDTIFPVSIEFNQVKVYERRDDL